MLKASEWPLAAELPVVNSQQAGGMSALLPQAADFCQQAERTWKHSLPQSLQMKTQPWMTF